MANTPPFHDVTRRLSDSQSLVLTGITIVAGVVLAANADLVKGISPTLAFTAGATGAVFGWAGVRG